MLLPLGLWETVRKHVKVIRKLHILLTSNHRPNVQKALRLVQTHKVPYRITGRAPRQTAQSLSWLQAALVWQSTRQFLMKKQGWERSACHGYHLATSKIWTLVFHSCRASTCIGVLLWTSGKCRPVLLWPALPCKESHTELLRKVSGPKGAVMNICQSAEVINTSKGHMHH